MDIIYFALIICTFVNIYWIACCCENSDTPVMSSIFGSFIYYVIAAAIAICVGGIISHKLPVKTIDGGTFDLLPMRSSNGVSGVFAYVSNTGNGRPEYRVNVHNSNGSETVYEVEAGAAEVVIDPTLVGVGHWHITYVVDDLSPWWSRFAVDTNYKDPHNVLTVPPDTVVQDFLVKLASTISQQEK